MTACALFYGLIHLIAYAPQDTGERVQTVVLAPAEQAAIARSLTEVAPKSRLIELAEENGFDVLRQGGPVFLVHRNLLSSGDLAFAREVALLMKGYEIGTQLSIEAFPEPVRARMEAKLLTAYEYMTGKKPSALPLFSAEPFPYLSIRSAQNDFDVSTFLMTRSFVSGYTAPKLHPETEGFVAQVAKPLSMAGSSSVWKPKSGSDAEPTLFYSRSIVEERRAMWAVDLWTALRDRLAEIRREYRRTIDGLAFDWLSRQAGFQGLVNGQCKFSDLSAQVQKDLLGDPRLPSNSNPESAEVAVRYFDFHIRFEVGPKDFIVMNLGQILATGEFPR